MKSESRPRDELWELVNGHFIAQTVYVAAKLGLADLLRERPQSVDELARATGTHPPTLHRLLRALGSLGVFVEDADGRYRLTPRGEYLRSDIRGSMRNWAMAFTGPAWWASWGKLLHSVETGEPAFTSALGLPFWEYLDAHPDEHALFNATMSANDPSAIVSAYDWSRFQCVADVGGGQGALLATILQATPGLRGILFDQPEVVASAHELLERSGVADRTTTVGGDFFDSVPPGADAYVLKVVIHDWEDEDAITILRSCRAAMGDTGTLLLIERLLAAANQPDRGTLMDLLMLVGPGGRERTELEYQRLYARAGFTLTRIVATPGQQVFIEGIPAK